MLYLVQHGAAVSENIKPDRPLSARGRGDVEVVAELTPGTVACLARGKEAANWALQWMIRPFLLAPRILL